VYVGPAAAVLVGPADVLEAAELPGLPVHPDNAVTAATAAVTGTIFIPVRCISLSLSARPARAEPILIACLSLP
jgi:hypothetical protein